MRKKSQVALEFLTTYGWAILVILIMISALSYFGILSPSKLLPERCSFGSEFICEDFALDTLDNPKEGVFRLKLTNNIGETITIDSIVVESSGVAPLDCGTLPEDPGEWLTGNSETFVWSVCNYDAAGFTAEEKGKVYVTVSYYLSASSSEYIHEVKGEIYATVI
ncbi:hypothetical protein KY347_02155 [Candidatus Woesearchaeota archaeon]|nr:hypothetical protein [Candidatus Woesearchaeota archaeon]